MVANFTNKSSNAGMSQSLLPMNANGAMVPSPLPPQQMPPGMMPGQIVPPGQMPPGMMPPGMMPPGMMPPGRAVMPVKTCNPEAAIVSLADFLANVSDTQL
eukprot:COSAG01_NODE_84_length_27672_cov_60.966344_23_plen_101_part_00